MRPRRDAEHQIQCAVIQHAQLLTPRYPELARLLAIPNGGWRTRRPAARAKGEGVRPGVWDLFLASPEPESAERLAFEHSFARWHGLWIEMKAPGGSLSPAQRDFGALMRLAGYACYVPPHSRRVTEARIVEATIEAMVAYLEGRDFEQWEPSAARG